MTIENEDLSVPGLDELLKETDGLLGEGHEEVPEGEGKANAAFAQQRQVMKKQQEMIKALAAKVDASTQSEGRESQPTSEIPVLPTDLDRARRQYQQNLMNRAMQRVGRPLDMRNSQDQADLNLEMMVLISEDRLAAFQTEQTRGKAGSTVKTVLAEFPELDNADRKAITEAIGVLPVELQANADTVRKEIYSYRGQHLEKFVPKQESQESQETVSSTVNVNPNEALVMEGVSSGQHPMFEDKKAGAAAASGLRGGSAGIKVPSPKVSGETIPRIKKDDRELMRKLHLDPKNASDVKSYLKAQEKKADVLL